jgi:hypothetical protein
VCVCVFVCVCVCTYPDDRDESSMAEDLELVRETRRVRPHMLRHGQVTTRVIIVLPRLCVCVCVCVSILEGEDLGFALVEDLFALGGVFEGAGEVPVCVCVCVCVCVYE